MVHHKRSLWSFRTATYFNTGVAISPNFIPHELDRKGPLRIKGIYQDISLNNRTFSHGEADFQKQTRYCQWVYNNAEVIELMSCTSGNRILESRALDSQCTDSRAGLRTDRSELSGSEMMCDPGTLRDERPNAAELAAS